MKMQKRYILSTMVATSMLYACGGSGDTTTESLPTTATGSLSVAIDGLPAGAQSVVSVTGPGGFSSNVNQSTTLSDLVPGTYTLTTSPVSADNIEFNVLPASLSVNVSANTTVSQELIYMTDVRSEGVISNFGSVFVNGVRFSTDDATVETDDSDNASEDDLRVGMNVTVKGRQTADGAITSASNIIHSVHVEGPLDAISLADNQLVVFGQVYVVDSRTVFDDITFETLQVGEIVEISAIEGSDDTWIATYVELEDDADSFKLSGEVSNLNSAEQQFNLGSVIIDYSQANIDAELANGQKVKVISSLGLIDGVINADRIQLKNDEDDNDSDRESIDGIISALGDNQFNIGDKTILWNESTSFKAGTSEDLTLGSRVKVKGTKTDDGIVAERIRFDKQSELEVEGVLQSVDIENSTVTVLNTVFLVDEFSVLKDDSDLEIRRFSLDQLNVGDLLEIEAFLNGDTLVVKTLEREEIVGGSGNDDDDAKLKGQVVAIEGNTMELLGTTVSTGQFTEFELGDADVSADVFFAQLAIGDWVEVEGIRQTDGSILATEIETSSANGNNGDDESGGVEFEGLISNFESPESFTVNGRQITTNDRTFFKGNALSMLANGVLIEVYGREADNGDILATKIELEDMDDRDDYDIEIKGLLEADAANGLIVVNQQEIRFNESTEFSDGGVADLLQGTFVEVEATLDEDGVLFANKIEIDDRDDDNSVELEGLISEILENGEIVVAGITIVLTEGTEFENGNMDRLEIGLYIEVEGRFNDEQKLIADELEFGEAERDELDGAIGQVLSDNQFTLGSFIVQHDRYTRFKEGSVGDIAANVELEVKGFFNDEDIFIAEKIEFEDD
ncbi:hypothetical protein KJ365_04330 [Glaciecola sp. XM2]|uniref:DUF5666 domain-containing protein n=1 Tax=Glaciecola sp. XM2 TaxID=1914931 RepID=UPI001BDEC09E|nr:DUF5666 domain-containing protein [Glaciecola sp. XM2]MBT1450096.1 hypothetical protein [Glaciecola sp. XM2]